MKNEKQRFVPLKERFDQFVQGLPRSQRATLKEPLKTLNAVIKSASELLFWSKIAPEVGKDSPFFAKLASHDLKAQKRVILKAAERNDKRFFIDLGKCLSGEMGSELYDQMDEHVALILALDPWISAKDAVCYLQKCGWSISEDAFRVRKQRLMRALAKFGVYASVQKQLSKRKVPRR
jgi:hypothetical protein